MFNRKISTSVLAAAAILSFTLAASATTTVRVHFKPIEKKSSVKVAGTSTLHDWTVKSNQIEGSASFPATKNGNKLSPDFQSKTAQPDFNVTIPVKSLTSGESGMDSTMFDAMKKSKYPKITYKLTSSKVKKVDKKKQKVYLDTKGKLTIHGVTKPIEMTFVVSRQSDNRITVWGKTDMKMSTFKIDPPTAMLGMVRSGDKITVTVNWVLKRVKDNTTKSKGK